MSVLLSSPPESVLRPVYVLPNSQDICVNQGKRGREDDSSDSVSVVGSVKRVKSLEPGKIPIGTVVVNLQDTYYTSLPRRN